MKSFAEYKAQCAGLTVKDAIDILIRFGCESDKIIICGPHGNYTVSVWTYCSGIPATVLASEIKPILFSGGPPNKYFWVRGTLNDLVVDKLMYSDAVTEKIGMKVATIKG